MELFLPLPILWSKNFFNKNVLIFTQEFKIDFQNRKRNYLNRKRKYLSHFQASDQKLLIQDVSHFYQGVWDCFSKQEMELSKQEMELFIPFPGLWSKNFFYNIFSILTKDFKIGFQNRKWNYANRIWKYFSPFQASDQNTSFSTSSSYLPGNSKLVFKTGNEMDQTGNRIISPTFRPLIKQLLLQHWVKWLQSC